MFHNKIILIADMEIEYNMLTFFFSGTLRARFTFRSVPEVETVNLILLGAECEVDCRVVDSACDVFDIHRIMANVSAFDVGTDLTVRQTIKFVAEYEKV